jgi:hypothetical protein
VLNAATGLSLLLCGTTVVLWVRSYWHEDRWFARRVQIDGDTFGGVRDRWLESVRGELRFVRSSMKVDRRRPAPPDEERGFYALGFSVLTHSSGATSPSGKQSIQNQTTFIGVPHWFAAAALAGAALPRLRRVWVDRRRRVGVGLCPKCGYDLRATPDRCPECGQVPASR